MMKRALVFLVPVLAACSASMPPQYSARLATESVFVREESSVELAERAVVAQAADDFQCPLGVVKSRIAGPDDARRIRLAEGCGKRAVYVRVTFDVRIHRPGLEELVPVHFVRFVALDADPVAHLRDVLRMVAKEFPESVEAVRPGVFPFPATLRRLTPVLEDWHALQVRAARALDCPVGETLPGKRERGRLAKSKAEGCGKRAWLTSDWLEGSAGSGEDLPEWVVRPAPALDVESGGMPSWFGMPSAPRAWR